MKYQAAISLVLTVVLANLAWAQDKADNEFRPKTVSKKAGKFKAITDIPLKSASETDLRDNELVLGVEVNGEARAYPINMLTGPSREILNDVLGGQAIAATW